MKKIYSLVALSMLLLILGITYASACGYHDHGDCCDLKTQTIIEGKITYSESEDLAGKASVTIICNHNGIDYTKTTTSVKNGYMKGTYFVIFPQSQCSVGDEVIVIAEKDDLTGENEGLVKNYITGRCLDIDIAIIDVALAPEFGAVVGVLTILGALGMFFVVRRK
jgi:hypothetical protein